MASNKQLLGVSEAEQDAALEKLAKLVLLDVPQRAIAKAFGVEQSRISQIVASQRFQDKLAELAAEQLEEQELLNQGWDSVEQIALSQVVKAMQMNPEPEFALKAAAVANKARRRGGIHHNPINMGASGKAVINLQINFAKRLQGEPVETELTGNATDMLNVSDVETLLNVGNGTAKTASEPRGDSAENLLKELDDFGLSYE